MSSEQLEEIQRVRKHRLNAECKKGLHNWQHHYSYANCSTCGETMDIPTPSDFRNDE